MEKENQQQKPAHDPVLLALRCSKASLLLSSLRQPRSPRTTTATTRRSSSSVESELRAVDFLSAGLAAAQREAAEHARISGIELLLVLSLVPVLLLFVGLLTAAAAAEAA